MKDGSYPVYIVVCFSGRVEKATGVSCLPRYWDSKRELIKAGCPNAPVLNKMLSDIKQRVISRRNEYEYNGRRYTPSMLLSDVQLDLSVGKSGLYRDLMERLIDERRLRDGTIRRYGYSYRKLCEYMKRDNFIIDELDLSCMKDFASWLERCNIKVNTIKTLLCCVAAVWNYAISKKVVGGDGYPFAEFKYTSKYKEVCRDYFLERSHIARLKEYWLDMVIERNGSRWSYREGALDRLHQRWSMEWCILWFLLCYKLNGSSPCDVALIKASDCKRIRIGSDDYWAIDIRRRKTNRPVNIRWKRDLFCQIALEHYMGFSVGKYVYPVIYHHDGMSDRQLLEQSHKGCTKAIRYVRKAFERINEDIARDNVVNGLHESTVDIERVVMYTARHSFACQYLSLPGASVSGLASLMARSANTIATYVHQLTKDEEIAEMVADMAI